MDGLCQTIKICGFQELGYYGLDFPWCNMQVKDDRICLRLGKAFATFEWLDHFGDTRVHHLVN